jgi:tetratricopeptide (TPR) repeat protein
MSGLMRCFSSKKIIVLGCLALLFGGCAGKTDSPGAVEAAKRSMNQANGDVDRACSTFYFLWGRHAELLLRFEEALEFYQKALICDEHADYISEKIPLLLLRLERTSEAESWLADYLKTHPDRFCSNRRRMGRPCGNIS